MTASKPWRGRAMLLGGGETKINGAGIRQLITPTTSLMATEKAAMHLLAVPHVSGLMMQPKRNVARQIQRSEHVRAIIPTPKGIVFALCGRSKTPTKAE